MKFRVSRITSMIIAGVFFLGGLSGPANAQVTAVNFGDLTHGTIVDDTMPVQYAFKAEAGDTVSFSVMAADARLLDLRVTLYDPFHNEIASNEEATGSNAMLQNFYIPRAGNYEIDVWGNTGSGDFDLTLDRNSTAADRKVILEDDFSDNHFDWATGGDSSIAGDIRDGKYVVEADCKTAPDAWFGAMDLSGSTTAPVFDQDFVAEMDVHFEPAVGQARVGWVFAVQPPDNQASSVLYQTDATWTYRVFDPVTGDFSDVINDSSRPVSLGDGKFHHLGLSVTADEVRMWIDGQQVAQVQANDALPGTIGLAGGCAKTESVDTVHAEFDNLVVTTGPAGQY